MEAEIPVHFATTKATSWRVIDGSLDDAVTCESSLSAVYSDANPVCRKRPLVLHRPSPDSGPCEIKISFEQQHEIRQVYVKSTARVYEIYYSSSQQDINEYLCTVRCGMAAKSEDSLEATPEAVLQETDCSKTQSVCSSGSTKHLDEGEGKTDSGSSSNEDGWVEVKDLKCVVFDDGIDSISGKVQASIQREIQDFYEATAEISDGNPCTSISLRLVSIQSGESVYIEEVYVFADPVLCDDEESTPTPKAMESSSNSYMMSMLVPTLLQLSKSRTSQPLSLGCTSDKIQKDHTPSSEVKQGSFSEKFGTASCQLTQEVPSQSSAKEENPGSREIKQSLSNIENMLGQLYLRVTRMEEFCSRFEEKMLNPINCMETRLQKVEQHLEDLVKKTSTLPLNSLGTRITAPDFCNASESQSSYNDEKCSSYHKEDDCVDEEVPQLLSDKVPSLVVTAPEFVCADDEEDSEVTETVPASPKDIPSEVTETVSDSSKDIPSEVSEAVIASPKDLPRKHLSINDALASALSGFLSSTLQQDQSTVSIPEVSSTNFSRDQEVCPSVMCDDDTEGGTVHFNKIIETNREDFVVEDKHELLGSTCFGEPTESILELDHVVDDQPLENRIDSVVEDHFSDAENGSMNDSTMSAERVELENVDEYVNESLDMDHTRDSVSVHGSGLSDVSNIAQKATGNEGVQFEGNSARMPLDILGLPTASVIDFKTPILDVQFAKRVDPLLQFSSLEALLTDDPKPDHEDMCSQEGVLEKISGCTYPVEVQENKCAGPEVIDHHMLVNLGAEGSKNLPLSSDEALQEPIEYKK